MARSFNLTAEINLRAPNNLKTIVADIRRELGTVSANVNLKVDAKSAKSISSVKTKLDAVNNVLLTAKRNTDSLNVSLQGLSTALSSVGSSGVKSATSIKTTTQSMASAAKTTKVASSSMEEFGKQAFLAVKRFAAFSLAAGPIYALVNAINSGFSAFVAFDKELVRLQQVTGKSTTELATLEQAIRSLAKSLGVSSESLTQTAVTLAQAGLTASETKVALEALAKTELAPSFDNLAETTEGAIAAIRQFDLRAGDLEAALGSVNAVAAAFAVEADDLIAAIQRTGGVFAAASRGVSEGTDALNEFLALFTSVRQTTREGAETIATGLRTIFTRIQRARTIDQLREFGIELTDLEGKFVGPFEAVRRLSEGLKQLDPRDIRFSAIVEELGGFRQIGKVIPLIQQFAVAQEALKVAQKGQGSLADAQIIAQKSLANQIVKVKEQFLSLIAEIGKSDVFQGLFKIVINLTSGLISLAGAFKPILPILAIIGAVKGVKAIGDFGAGFFGSMSKGSARGTGQNLGSTLTGSKEKEKNDATTKASEAIKANTSALTTLTSAVQALTAKIGTGGTTLSDGGKVLGFNRGGVVPGSGKGDKIPAMLEPGEVVMSNQAAQKYGRGNLASMNKYAWGGKISSLTKYYKSLPNIDKAGYAKISDQKIIDRSVFKEVKPTDLTTEEILDWRGDSLPRWKKFENLLSNKYNLGQPSDYKFGYLDFPKTRSEAKFMKLGDTYADPDTLKGNNPGTIAGKNFLFANSKGTNKRPSSLSNIQISETPVTTYWADPSKFDKAALLSGGGLIKKFMAGSPGGIRVASGKGRGKAGAKGARDIVEPISTETYLKWAKSIYDEYDADPSLTMAIGPGGRRMPPEIALADKLLAQYAFETGGAGLAVGTRFVRTPKNQISDELKQYLVQDPSDPSEMGFYEDVVAKFGRTRIKAMSEKQIAKIGKEQDMANQTARIADWENAYSSEWSKITPGGEVDKHLMSTLTGEILNDYQTARDRGGEALAKDYHRTRLKKAVRTSLENMGSDTDYSGDFISDALINRMAQDLYTGGIVQQFMAGSVGGVEAPAGKISQDILDRIQKVGGSGYITANVGYDQVQKAVAQARALVPKVGTSKQLLTLPSLKSLSNGSLLEEVIEPLLSQAEEIKEAELAQQAGQKQLNEQAAAGKGLKFGLASLYGPSGQLGYSSVTNAKELLGKDGTTKYLTQLVRKSLPNRYSDALSKIQQDIVGLPARGAEQFQYADIFGSVGPLAFDFDETLVKDADIFGPDGNIDIQAYSDLQKVRDALQNAKLTLLGKELAKRLIDYPELMDSVRVLTARPQSNAPLLASRLSSLGLPIPESKITGVDGGLNKVNNLTELETLIDDNLENIGAVLGAGKRGYLYREPQNISAANQSSQRAIAAIEGYDLEEIVKQLGVGISSDDANPLRPIDYPNGLGYAANIWGLDANMPTDTKRTNDGSAVSRLWAEAQKYIVQNFAFGGRAEGPGFEEVRKQIMDKYPEIDFRISKRKRGFGYNLMGALKSAGGLSGDTSLNFQQPTNLKQLQEYSDKLAGKLMNAQELAEGGLAKPQKNFGQIALRTGSRIQATYMKEGQAGQDRSGQVIADKINSSLYAVQSSAATKGYGPKLYDVVMEAATAEGAMLTSDRRTVSEAAKSVWAYYFNNRSDVQKTRLDPENWVSNNRLLDEKLYGPPETWPPANDPAWILQTGYSKAPNLINTPDVVRVDPIKKAIANNEPYLPDMLSVGGFSSGDTVPAMVSNQEGFVPPKLAKQIGYAKLDRMNQADRNGMAGFAEGGITKFKGPGSGTSDSIGPIGLPKGSYVIRAKAMKAMNLNKGGSVGAVQRFALGGTAQDQEYFEIKAKQAGQSLDKFAKTLVYSAKDLARSMQEAQKVAKIDLKALSIELSDKYKAASSGSDVDNDIRSNIAETIGNKLREINPQIDPGSAKTLATQIADKMSKGATFDSLLDASTGIVELKDIMEKSLSSQEAQTEALKRVSMEQGLSPEVLERLLGDRARGNQDNGLARIVEFFGGPLKATTRSMLLAASLLEGGAKLFFGATTKFSATFSGVLGGLQGGAQGAAVVAEMDVAANLTEFGKFLESFGGRLGNVGLGLQKFAVPLQAGAIAFAAVSGAIKGFANAFNQANLEKQLLELGLATDKTKEAFERLQKTPTATNATLAQQALGQEMQAIEGLRQTAAVDIRGRRSIETARSLDITGITSAVSGQEQEKEARKAFFDVSARRFEQFGTLGARRLNEVDPKQIEDAVAQANKEDAGISRLAQELEDLKAAPTRDEAAITAKQIEIDEAQQTKAEGLFRKSQRFGQIAVLEGEQEALRQFYLNQAQTEEEKLQRLKALNGQFGDTDKERAENQEKAINAAKRLAAAEAETELRTKLLSDATQKLSLQTENLLRTYSVASAILQRFGESIDLIAASAEATTAALEGRAQIGNVDRSNERVLENIEAYSLDEVRAAAVQTGQLAGGGLPGETLQNQVLTAKILQESLPQALATTGSEDVGEVIDKLEDSFNQAGVAFSEPIKQQLRESLSAEVSGRQGTSFQKLANESEIVANLLKQTEAGLKAAQEFQKRYNDALATAIQLQNGYAQALQQSIDYQIQSAEIRANADLQLKEALGQRVTSADRNAAFDTRIRTLTSTNIIPGGTTDPEKIFQQLVSGVAGQRAQEEELTRRKQDFAGAPTEDNKARVAEQLQAIAKQNVAINNSRKALEELANDGSKAANALKDLQDIDRVASGATNFTRDVLTSTPEDLAKINKQLLSFTKFRSGQATAGEINNLEFRQNAFAGGDLIKSVLPKEIADQLDAQLSLDMLRNIPGSAQALGAVVGQGPDGEPITLESALQMKAGGRDPVQEKYIKAYQDAVDVQAQAAAKLGEAAQQVAQTFNDKMIQVLTEIQQQLPNILEQSVTAGMTPAVAAAYKELNTANKERQALDAAQASAMGLDATQFNAVNTAYDAVVTSRQRTQNLALSQAKAQGFDSVAEFQTSAPEKYNTFVESEQYKKSLEAQAAAEQNFASIATAAGVSPEIARDISDYRSADPYTQATARIAEKEAAFEAAQTGPQPAEKPRTEALEVTAADTAALEAARQQQQNANDFTSGIVSFGSHVVAFAAAVAAFAAFGGIRTISDFVGRRRGRGGRAGGTQNPRVRPTVSAAGSSPAGSRPPRRAAGAAPSTPQSGPPRRAAGAAPSTPQAGPPRRGAAGATTPSVRPVVATAPSAAATPAVSGRGARTVAATAAGALVDKASLVDEVVGVATSAANIATGQGTVQDVVYGAADAAELAGRGGGLLNFLNKIPGVGAVTKAIGGAGSAVAGRLGLGGLGAATGSVGSALGIGKPILGATGGVASGAAGFAALSTAISAITNAVEFASDPAAYSARKQAQSDAGLQRAQERTGYGEFATDSLGGALEGFLDPIGKIVEAGYVAKDASKDFAGAIAAELKTERMTAAAQQEISQSRGGGAIAKLAFDEQRKAMEEAQIKTELQAAQRVQATGGSLGDLAKIFDTTEQGLGATNLQDFIAKKQARLQELPQDRIDSRERSKDWTLDFSSNADPSGFADAVAQELQYRLAQLQLPPLPVKPEVKPEDATKLDITKTTTPEGQAVEQKTQTETAKAVDTITSSSTSASKALDNLATSTQGFIDVISGKGQQSTTPTTRSNVYEDMQKANEEMLEARSKVQIYKQGIQGKPEDIKAYEESLDRLEKAKAAVASQARTKPPQTTIPAPVPPGANVVPGASTPVVGVAPALPQAAQTPFIGVAPALPPTAATSVVGVAPATPGLEPRPEIALQQAEADRLARSSTKPPVTQQPTVAQESVKLDDERQKVIDANRKAKQKEVESLKKQVAVAQRNVTLNKANGATGEKSSAILSDKEAKLAVAQQDLANINQQEADELEEVRKSRQLAADLAGKQVQYTVREAAAPQISTEKTQASSYESMLQQRKQQAEAEKKARRDAYLQRTKPFRDKQQKDKEEARERNKAAFDRRISERQAQMAVAQEKFGPLPDLSNAPTLDELLGPSTDIAIPPQDQSALALIAGAATQAPSFKGGYVSDNDRAFVSNIPTTLTSPVPTPLRNAQTPQFTAQTVATDQAASSQNNIPTTIGLDAASLTAFTDIQKSFAAFGGYVSELANIRLPDKIEITGGGNYTMEVNITGAAAMEMLETKTKELAEKFIVTEIQELKDKLNKVFPSEFKASGSGGESANP